MRDDNLVDHALAGLVADQRRVPTDVEVVVHRNFPWTTPNILPVRALGFDCRTILRRAMELIDLQRRGEQVPGVTQIPALFEDELTER